MMRKDLIFVGLSGINFLLWISLLLISHFYTEDPIKANLLIQLFPAFVMVVSAWLIVRGNELPLALLNLLKVCLVAAFIGMIILIVKFVRAGA